MFFYVQSCNFYTISEYWNGIEPPLICTTCWTVRQHVSKLLKRWPIFQNSENVWICSDPLPDPVCRWIRTWSNSRPCVVSVSDPLEQLVRHFLIETGPRGVKIKGCQNEPYFGKQFFYTLIQYTEGFLRLLPQGVMSCVTCGLCSIHRKSVRTGVSTFYHTHFFALCSQNPRKG